jgi:hypothetical protein
VSERLYATVHPPTGAVATPVTSLQTLNEGIGKLESDAILKGVKPVWDTLEIETDEEVNEERTLVGASTIHRTRWFSLSVLTIDPKEVSE